MGNRGKVAALGGDSYSHVYPMQALTCLNTFHACHDLNDCINLMLCVAV